MILPPPPDRSRYTYKRKTPRGHDVFARRPDDPTEEEIAAMCEAIRATWSKRERLTRLAGPQAMPERVEVTEVPGNFAAFAGE
jgi:hypothetical protein